MAQSFKDQVAIITGAGGGIGRAIAEAFLEQGAKVAAVDLSKDTVCAGFAEARAAGKLLPLAVDLSNLDALQTIVPGVLAHFGRLDMLVNNAARISRHLIADSQPDEWERIIAVNLRAPYFLSKDFAEAAKRRAHGRIVNMSSQAGTTGGAADCPIYAITKGAMNTMTKSFARAYAADGVTVNAVSPGLVMTEMISKTLSSERIDQLIEGVPVKKFSTKEEIAAAVLFLCSDKASTITGHVLDVNGGMLMR